MTAKERLRFKAVTWSGYTRDRLRKDFLEVRLVSKYSKNKGKLNFLEGTKLLRSSPCALFQDMTANER